MRRKLQIGKRTRIWRTIVSYILLCSMVLSLPLNVQAAAMVTGGPEAGDGQTEAVGNEDSAKENITEEQEGSGDITEGITGNPEENNGVEKKPVTEAGNNSEEAAPVIEESSPQSVGSGENDREKEVMEPEAIAAPRNAAVEQPEVSDESTDVESENTDTGARLQITEQALTLKYDDRYALSDIKAGYVVISIENMEITSYQVRNGETAGELDDAVVTLSGDSKSDIIASGIGKAKILMVPESQEELALSILSGDTGEGLDIIDALQINVTVEPARLTLMYVAGQSNAEGMCSWNLGYTLDHSIACAPGTVYSTYAAGNEISDMITGVSFSAYCTAGNAPDFVAGSLTGGVSISGKPLEYGMEALTEEGTGKTGIDSGLAYKWNLLTQDKVWVVNTSLGSTSITTWIPGMGNYERSKAVSNLVQQTYQAEISAGHYMEGKKLLFWQQGEADKGRTAESYKTYFNIMYEGVMQDYNLDAFGIIMIRSCLGTHRDEVDLYMSGPRIAQYGLGSSRDLDKVFVVSNANEQWVTDQGVADYFAAAYPNGFFSYPIRNAEIAFRLPTTVAQVHDDIHYSQIGHNENGLTAAYGMYRALYRVENVGESSVSWRGEDGLELSQANLIEGESMMIWPVVEPVYQAKEMAYSVSGKAASYDLATGWLTGMNIGLSELNGYDKDGMILSVFPVTVNKLDPLDMTRIAGDDYTGLFYHEKIWWYLENGWIQPAFEGIVENENGQWYVKDGRVNFNYTGIVRDGNDWWYIKNGQLDFGYTGVARNENGWWYIKNGQLDLGYTGVARNENGWWYIKNGQLDFGYTGVAKNENGWWRIKNGQVDFSYTGVARNENGWWYIKNGQLDFGYTGVARNENGWWYIKNGQLDFGYTGVARNENGWWYIKNGQLDFGYTGVARNENGWWYIKNGQLDFGYTGVARNENGWWYIKNGQLDFGYTGIARNDNGWWYIKNGQLDFSYTGVVISSGIRYQVKNGHAARM